MIRLLFLSLFGGITALCGAASHAQPTIEAEITAVSGRSIYLNVGERAGIQPELIVRMSAAGLTEQFAIIEDVAANSCRAELQLESPIPEVGMIVSIVLFEDTTAEQEEDEAATDPMPKPKPVVPAHPPWQRTVDTTDPDAPLLAPAVRQKPEERPSKLRGRIYSQIRYLQDVGGNRDNSYTFYRLGTRLEMTNPFSRGGRLLFRGSIDRRGADLSDESDSDTRARIDRLSYAIGGMQHSEYRAEFGRFYSVYVPEIGLVDGIEGAVYLDNNWRLGAGAGLYPAPFVERDIGDDYGVHLFADYKPNRGGTVAGTIAYQQTWHEGAPDQNLFIGRINTKPSKAVSIYGLALVNLYTNSDTIKGSGLELTQGNINVRYAPDRTKGANIGYTRTLYPEIKRRDFDHLPEDLLRDGQIDRVSISAWMRPSDHVRLTARANRWSDQRDSGLGGEAGAEWYEVWRDSATIRGSVYFTDGTFSDGLGARLLVGERFGEVDVDFRYDVFSYTSQGMIAGNETRTRHTIHSDISWRNGVWRYNLDTSYTFGDDEESISLRALVEYRF